MEGSGASESDPSDIEQAAEAAPPAVEAPENPDERLERGAQLARKLAEQWSRPIAELLKALGLRSSRSRRANRSLSLVRLTLGPLDGDDDALAERGGVGGCPSVIVRRALWGPMRPCSGRRRRSAVPGFLRPHTVRAVRAARGAT